MDAKATLQTLLQLGAHVKDAFSQFSLTTGKGWLDFLSSDVAKAAEGDVSDLIEELTLGDIESAVAAAQARRQALLNGRPVTALSFDELTQLHALLDVENALVLKEVDKVGSAKFWNWLVNTAVPVLLTAGKIVITLL
jgi:hypothetical protein